MVLPRKRKSETKKVPLQLALASAFLVCMGFLCGSQYTLLTLSHTLCDGNSSFSKKEFCRILQMENAGRQSKGRRRLVCYQKARLMLSRSSNLILQVFMNFSPRERPLMMSNNFWTFLTYLPTHVQFCPMMTKVPI